MSKPKDGGRAFRNIGDYTPERPLYAGMSLSDWFAGQVLPPGAKIATEIGFQMRLGGQRTLLTTPTWSPTP